MRPTLYLMLGYPGAGKSTAAHIIHELTGAEHISSDTLRLKLFPHPTFSAQEHDQLYRELDKRTEELLRAGKDVVYDANLNRFRHRQEKYAICERTGAKALLLWVQTPNELAKTRAVHDSRSHLWPGDETPQGMFERSARVIEEPRTNEPYTVVDGTRVTPAYIAELLGLE
jgi:predicted kinase